jgi:modulator of FtsH protease HflC
VNDRLLAPVSALVAVLVVAGLSVFTVSEQEFAVRMRFGQVQPGDYSPGLHWCWPFERIERVDRRVVAQRLQAEPFVDSAQQGLSADIDLSWRVRDPGVYLRAGTGPAAQEAVAMRLAAQLRTELKASYAQLSLAQIVAAPRGGVTDALVARLRGAATELGVTLVDARVKRIDPSDAVANAIYERMQSAYATQARQVRAAGAAEGDRVRAAAERNRGEIVTAAERDAQRLRGEGDAQAVAIHARAYAVNPEFAAFYRSLQAYRNALGREGDILVIQPDGEFYKYLRSPTRH